MDGYLFSLIMIGSLLIFVFAGVNIVSSLGIVSLVGISMLMGGITPALNLLSNTAYESIRDYVFAVIPLFVLMGELVARCGAAGDLYQITNRALGRIPGRLAIATVFGNTIFGAVTGVSIASAATFSRIAYPAMIAHGYDRSFSLGSIAGSAALGMIIPPSVLMIVWGVLTELSVGKLFMAGILPGIILSFMYAAFILIYAIKRPDLFGGTKTYSTETVPLTKDQINGSIGIGCLIVLVLGGIWFGIFTPTEAAGIGALMALVLARYKGMTWSQIADAVWQTGRTSAPILFLLIMAQLYSRLLAFGGIVDSVHDTLVGLGLGRLAVVAIMFLIWFILGMFIDSVSIILLTVPIFHPIAVSMGIDPIAFAIIGILAIEAGLVTPPFGISVFTVKSTINDPTVSLGSIFKAATPYWIMLLILAAMILYVPSIATVIPRLM